MTDQELLELAAKAAGLTNLVYCPAWKSMAEYDAAEEYYKWETYWNPLVRDSDALRLAVAVKLKRKPAPVFCSFCFQPALSAAPLDGDEVLAQRIAALTAKTKQ